MKTRSFWRVNPVAVLHQLLCALFNGPDLRRFIRFGEQGEPIASRLPEGNVTLVELVDAVVEQLQRRALVDATLARMRHEFPLRIVEIDHVARLWSVEARSDRPIPISGDASLNDTQAPPSPWSVGDFIALLFFVSLVAGVVYVVIYKIGIRWH
jgi:hypothetical protein